MLKSFDDGRLFGATFGEGTPWLLALHGWQRNRNDFAGVLDSLDGIAVDLPGFGASPPPPSAWGSADYARAVEPVLSSLRSPAVLLGHSFGGLVALQLAVRRPEAVSALVLAGVPLRTGPPRRPSALLRLVRRLHRIGLVSDQRMEALRRRRGSVDYRAAEGVMRAVLVRTLGESYENELRALRCPVELVWGEGDSETPVAVAEAAARLVGSVTLSLVPGAGHMTPITAPLDLRRAVERHGP